MKAYSSKRAAGLWQFMPKTATKYGLKIDEYVDERRDLVKSTKAAATYLSFLHDMFGKWYLAAIAYNCGEGRLLDAIDKAGSDELAVLLDEEKKYIPLESRNYIRKIIALALIGSDEEYLMKSEYAYLLDRSDENGIATVKISSGESLSRISELLKMPLADLKELNGHLKYDFVPPYKGGYDIYIPHEKLADFKRKYTKESIAKIYKIHTVQAGDNLSKIGKKYGVSYHVIKDFNNLHSNRLKIKQKLIIPIPKKSKSHQLLSKNYYMVKRGDSLESIARRHHVSVQMIRQQNNLKGSFIKAGERLKIYE
jgi:membrane-bound lytic murein transglycosylase D